jgi:hypothetical protein
VTAAGVSPRSAWRRAIYDVRSGAIVGSFEVVPLVGGFAVVDRLEGFRFVDRVDRVGAVGRIGRIVRFGVLDLFGHVARVDHVLPRPAKHHEERL